MCILRFCLPLLLCLAAPHVLLAQSPSRQDWLAAGWPERLIPIRSDDPDVHSSFRFVTSQCALVEDVRLELLTHETIPGSNGLRPRRTPSIHNLSLSALSVLYDFSEFCFLSLSIRCMNSECADTQKIVRQLLYAKAIQTLLLDETMSRVGQQFKSREAQHRRNYEALELAYAGLLEKIQATPAVKTTDWTHYFESIIKETQERRTLQEAEQQQRWQNYHLWGIGDELRKRNLPPF